MEKNVTPMLPVIMTEVESYTKMATTDPHLHRMVDMEGDWTHYFQDEINRYLVAVNHVIGIGFPKGHGLIEWFKKMTPDEIERRVKSSQEQGANVHSAIRYLIDGRPINKMTPFQNDRGDLCTLNSDEWQCLMSWVEWAKLFKPQVLNHETAVWNKKHLYAGTVDFIGTIELPAGCKVYIDDKLVTIKETRRVAVAPLDWKTGGAYDEHKVQTSAYTACIKRMPKGEWYTGTVRLGTRHQNGGFEVRLWSKEKTKQHFKLFQNAMQNYKFLTGNKDWEPNIVKIPLTLEMNVPRITGRKKANATTSNKGNSKRQGQVRKPAQDQSR